MLLTKSLGITAQERVVSFPILFLVRIPSTESRRENDHHIVWLETQRGTYPAELWDTCSVVTFACLTSTQRHRHAYTRFTYRYSGCPFIGRVTLSLPTWFLLLLGDALPHHLVLELYPGATTHICLSSSCESLQPWQWQPLWLADVCLFVQKLKVLSEHILLLPSSLHSTSHSAESRVIC